MRFTAACRGFRTQRITLVTTVLDAARYPAVELIAHNLIRCVMAAAARAHAAALERLSFKGTVDARRQYSAVLAQARTDNANSSRICSAPWPAIRCPGVRDEANRAPSNDAPNRSPY